MERPGGELSLKIQLSTAIPAEPVDAAKSTAKTPQVQEDSSCTEFQRKFECATVARMELSKRAMIDPPLQLHMVK
jgi:hypothetical protein